MPHPQIMNTSSSSSSSSSNTTEIHPSVAGTARLDLRDIKDRVDVMRRQEETTYRSSDYLGCNNGRTNVPSPVSTLGHASQDQTSPIDEMCRMKMSQWCFQVIDFAKFRRDTVSIAMNLLDRFLSLHPTNDVAREAMNCRKIYQLASMTTLYMAIKIFEPITMEVEVFSNLSRGCYARDDFVSMEQKILSALNWRMNGPTVMNFVELFLSALPLTSSSVDSNTAEVMSILWTRSKYQSELASLDYEFVTKKPSIIAFSAIKSSMNNVPNDIFSGMDRSAYLARLELLCEESCQSVMVQSITTKLVKMETQHQSTSASPDSLKPRAHCIMPSALAPTSPSRASSGYTSPNCVTA